MKVISNHKEINKEFKRLSEQYSKYYWAVAWASTSNTQFEFLQANQHKIENIVVGLHFYQTHPEFIKAFLSHKGVKFIKQPEGTFHPKVYLFFETDERWELIIGSANYTDAAFSKNCEANILITSKDNDAADVLNSVLALVKSSWNDGSYFDKAELQDYERVWKNQQQKINSLSGLYGGTKTRVKQFFNTPIAKMTWEEYVSKVMFDKQISKRLRILSEVRKMFERVKHFSDLTSDERKFISGLPNKHHLTLNENLDWGFFGRMDGAGEFNGIINKQLPDTNISKALDAIPLTGQITKSDYDRFVEYFEKSGKRQNVAPASRLLAMKRPDVFFCKSSANEEKLINDFGIKVSKWTYEKYWSEIVSTTLDSEWWQNPQPKNEFENNISQSRAALLDSIYYVPKVKK